MCSIRNSEKKHGRSLLCTTTVTWYMINSQLCMSTIRSHKTKYDSCGHGKKCKCKYLQNLVKCYISYTHFARVHLVKILISFVDSNLQASISTFRLQLVQS